MEFPDNSYPPNDSVIINPNNKAFANSLAKAFTIIMKFSNANKRQ